MSFQLKNTWDSVTGEITYVGNNGLGNPHDTLSPEGRRGRRCAEKIYKGKIFAIKVEYNELGFSIKHTEHIGWYRMFYSKRLIVGIMKVARVDHNTRTGRS